jgi:hypothetical protein
VNQDRAAVFVIRGDAFFTDKTLKTLSRSLLLHHLWVSGEGYEPLHNSSRITVVAAA